MVERSRANIQKHNISEYKHICKNFTTDSGTHVYDCLFVNSLDFEHLQLNSDNIHLLYLVILCGNSRVYFYQEILENRLRLKDSGPNQVNLMSVQ